MAGRLDNGSPLDKKVAPVKEAPKKKTVKKAKKSFKKVLGL